MSWRLPRYSPTVPVKSPVWPGRSLSSCMRSTPGRFAKKVSARVPFPSVTIASSIAPPRARIGRTVACTIWAMTVTCSPTRRVPMSVNSPGLP